MKRLLFVLLVIGLGMAFTVSPDYIEVQDTGNENLPTLDISMTIDCDTKEIAVTVTNGTAPVEDASVYLFYTDYAYQPLPYSGKTDSSGRYIMEVTGNIEFLTDMYVLRVDHPGYRSREIEFSYVKCLMEPPQDLPPPECVEGGDCEEDEICVAGECVEAPECTGDADCLPGYICENQECIEDVSCYSDEGCPAGSVCEDNECVPVPAPPPQNATENETNASPQTMPPEPPPEEEMPAPCPVALGLLLLLAIRMKG
ncbi:hypothetical protein GF318_01160 [Candidatus Micrarchaeota archaeon]|nr:hypothetical protein [Candidatus Micrarchaeota archaeon]